MITGILAVLAILVGIPITLFVLAVGWKKGVIASPGTKMIPVLGGLVLACFVYYLPTLMKDSLPGKALLSALGSNAEWYEWLVWVTFGIIAFLAWRWFTKPSASDEKGAVKPNNSRSWVIPLGLTMALVVVGLAWGLADVFTGGLITSRVKNGSVPDLVKLPVPSNIGQRTRGEGGVHSTFIYTAPPHPKSDGKSTLVGCGEIIDPVGVRSDPNAPTSHLEMVTDGSTYENYFRVTDEMRRYLDGFRVTKVGVQFTLVTSTLNAPNPCRYTRR